MTPYAMQPSLSSPSVYNIVYIYTKPAKIFSFEKEKSCMPDVSRERIFLLNGLSSFRSLPILSFFYFFIEIYDTKHLTFVYIQFIFVEASNIARNYVFPYRYIAAVRETLIFYATHCRRLKTC